MTLEEGLMRTWRFPAFSALLMALSASLRTEVLTILAVEKGSQIVDLKRGTCQRNKVSLHGP